MTLPAVELRQVLELKVGKTILFGMYSSFATGLLSGNVIYKQSVSHNASSSRSIISAYC